MRDPLVISLEIKEGGSVKKHLFKYIHDDRTELVKISRRGGVGPLLGDTIRQQQQSLIHFNGGQ